MALPGGVSAIVNGVTETNDLVNALHDALPRELQAKSGRIGDRLRALYRHWDQVDMRKGFRNVVFNEIEDRAIGKIGVLNAKASARFGAATGRPVGFQTGRLH